MDHRLVVKTIGLTRVFKDFWRRDKVTAVQNLDLEIRSGEVFGLLGPNGSGKSTTIKMLLGLLYPTRGRISIFGKPPTDVVTKSRIGYLPEESYLYRFLNARETLQLYAKLFQQTGDVRNNRIDKLLEMVGLQHQAKRRIGEYSKGMARRIGLAQALINDPDFLILDEPTTGLDPIGTNQIKELIRELARRGKTILLSSHLLSDVQDVCDRVCILYGGQVQAEGEIHQLLSQKQTTQITSAHLQEGTVAEIKRVIKRLENKENIEVSHPTEKLENFFIRIVEDAQKAKIVTSGAAASGRIADFLAESAQEQVIESLVAAGTVPFVVQPNAPETIFSSASPSNELIDELLKDSQSSRSEQPAAGPQTVVVNKQDQTLSSVDSNVDRDVINTLLNTSETQDRG